MDSFSHETGSFSGKGGIEIFFQKWIADKAKAVMVVVHGLGEHSGRYENLIKSLAGKKISVMAIDLRGHGKSEGNRGHIDSFMDYIYDLKLFIEYIKSDYRNVPIVMYGHGLGGVISTKYSITYSGDISKLILSSPSFAPVNTLSGIKKGIVAFFSPRIPTMSMSSGLNIKSISRDEETVKSYGEDKLVHGKVSVRWVSEYLSASSECVKSSRSLKCPVLIFQGKADEVADYSITEKFFSGIKVENKDLLLYDDLYHETINEPQEDRVKVLKDVVQWIEASIAGIKGSAKKTAPKKSEEVNAPAEKAIDEKTATKKTAAKKAPVKKATAKKTAAKKTPVKKAAAKKTAAKKAPVKKAAAKKTASKKTPVKKAAAKKTAAKKTAAKKAPAKKTDKKK